MKKILLGFLLCCSIFTIGTINTHAEEETSDSGEVEFSGGEQKIVTTKKEFDVNSTMIIEEYMENPEVGELIIVDPELAGNDTEIIPNYYESNQESIYNGITTYAGITKYKVNNVRNGNDYTGGSIATTSGGPGVTLSISQTKSISTQLSSSFGASNKVISAGVGWNVTGSSSISISGSYKVPSKIGNKKVKSCKFTANTVYKTKQFDVQKMAWNSTKWAKQGTGTVKKAYGVSFKKSFTYK